MRLPVAKRSIKTPIVDLTTKAYFQIISVYHCDYRSKKLDMLLPTLPGSSPHPKFPKAVKFETSYVQKLHDLVEFFSRPSPIVETLECNAKNHVHVHCINYSISS